MPNLYASLAEFKDDVADAAIGVHYDDLILRLIEASSRRVETELLRVFYEREATHYFPAPGTFIDPDRPRRMWLGESPLSLTSVELDEDEDLTYEKSLTEGTDYRIGPPNEHPKEYLEVLVDSGKLSRWPKAPETVKAVGTWAYDAEKKSVGTLDGNIDSSTTTVTLNASHKASAGQTLFIDDEQFHVEEAPTPTLTVERAINGTAAAAHTDGTTVYRKVFPAALVQGVVMYAARLFFRRSSGYANVLSSSAETSVIQTFRSVDPDAAAMLAGLRRPR